MRKEHKNINKKNKQLIKKAIFISLIIILTTVLVVLFQKIYNMLLYKKTFENSIIAFSEKNQENIFRINKIVFFSSSDSKTKSSSASNFTIENLYTYTDIALFIDNNSEENKLDNTLKSLKIENIKFTKKPNLGEPNLYFKSINNFSKSEINQDLKINNELEFKITSKDNADLTNPVLYNNCANPITLTYINQNIKTDYTMTDTQNPITYNGKLLKRCGVLISSIETSISFDIEIENNKNQKFRTNVYFNIPYENDGNSIYDGSLKLEKDTKFNFYRYE